MHSSRNRLVTRLLTAAVSICLISSTARGGDVLFSAKLSAQDHYNSAGEKLTSVAAIIQQDRANFHKFNQRDPEDQSDGGLFSSAKARAELGTALTTVRISDSLRKKILHGTPTIYIGIDDGNSLVIGLKENEVVANAGSAAELSANQKAAKQGPEGDVMRYRLAAEHGDAEEQFILGLCYAIGKGVPQDDVLAYMWFNLAGASGYENAKTARADLSERMSPDQIAEAQKLSRQWKPKGQ